MRLKMEMFRLKMAEVVRWDDFLQGENLNLTLLAHYLGVSETCEPEVIDMYQNPQYDTLQHFCLGGCYNIHK